MRCRLFAAVGRLPDRRQPFADRGAFAWLRTRPTESRAIAATAGFLPTFFKYQGSSGIVQGVMLRHRADGDARSDVLRIAAAGCAQYQLCRQHNSPLRLALCSDVVSVANHIEEHAGGTASQFDG